MCNLTAFIESIKVLVGSSRDVGEMLVHDRRAPLISATGSCNMGRKIGGAVSKRLGRSLLELGGNDALRGYPPRQIAANLAEMIKIAELSNVKVILMQIKIPPNYGSRYQKAFESIYINIASETNVKLMPFMLEEIALNKDLMLPDGIHPKASAQPMIAEFIYLQLKPLLIQ